MAVRYEELDFRSTPRGELLLRRRRPPGLGDEWVYEVKLDGELLMSSLLTDSERALADLSLAAAPESGLRVLVGGLGLGETADAALADERVTALTVIEISPEVVEWHRRGLVPLGPRLTGDPRCELTVGDFFRALGDPAGESFHAILVDIDHAPDSWLNPEHAEFYGEAGIARAASGLEPGGVFGFWSSGRVSEGFLRLLEAEFEGTETHEVTVENPWLGEEQTDTIYVARKGGTSWSGSSPAW